MKTTQSDILEVAYLAFEQWKQGLKTGNWQGFLDLLTDDFTFWFPVGSYQGENIGKTKATEFFHYVSEKVFPEGLFITLVAVTHNQNSVVFEVQSQGKMFNSPYENQATITFEIRDQQICRYHESLRQIYL